MECACVCVDTDGDPCEFYRERWVKRSRKYFKCHECGRQILKGESYLYISGKWDGDIMVHRICQDCDSVIKSFFCSGYMFERIWEDLTEHIRDCRGDISEDCIVILTPLSRDKVCEIIEETWEDYHDA